MVVPTTYYQLIAALLYKLGLDKILIKQLWMWELQKKTTHKALIAEASIQ